MLRDIREFARDLVEATGSEEADRKSYLQLLPKHARVEVEDDPDAMEDFKRRFAKKDLTLYSDHQLWYKALSERLRAKACQYISVKPKGFDIHLYARSLP